MKKKFVAINKLLGVFEGQIYPDRNKSNNIVYNALAVGIIRKIIRKEKGYKITIADASDVRQVIIPLGPELLVSEGES